MEKNIYIYGKIIIFAKILGEVLQVVIVTVFTFFGWLRHFNIWEVLASRPPVNVAHGPTMKAVSPSRMLRGWSALSSNCSHQVWKICDGRGGPGGSAGCTSKPTTQDTEVPGVKRLRDLLLPRAGLQKALPGHLGVCCLAPSSWLHTKKGSILTFQGNVSLLWEKEMATHSSVPAWGVPWTEEPGGCSPRGRKESDTTEWLRSLKCAM